MQSKQVFRIVLLGLAGTFLAYNTSGQSKLECPLVLELFYKLLMFNGPISKATFEVLNAHCTDIVMQGRLAKASLTLDTKLVKIDWDLPPGNPLHGQGSDRIGGLVPLGSKYRIIVEATYTLGDTGWKADSFTYKDSQH